MSRQKKDAESNWKSQVYVKKKIRFFFLFFSFNIGLRLGFSSQLGLVLDSIVKRCWHFQFVFSTLFVLA